MSRPLAFLIALALPLTLSLTASGCHQEGDTYVVGRQGPFPGGGGGAANEATFGEAKFDAATFE